MSKSLLVVLLLSTQALWAESQTDVDVPEITVLGAQSKSSTLDFVPTVSELSGTRLERKKQSTIGETLSREVGITSTEFGPNASRPVIRGMDGDRIRILQNGTGVLDASAASQDHAVAVEPLTVERVEIVRGPAALLYGSNAVGGVVNMVTNRIPEQVPEKFNGQGEARFSSTDLGRSAGVGMSTPVGAHWVAHIDASQRAADDYHVPGYARIAPQPDESKGRAYNSWNHTGSGAAGLSYVTEQAFVGTAFSDYESQYGTVAERFVHINMLQQRWDVNGEIRNVGFLKSVRAKNSYSHYKHDEIESGQLGTSFKNDGDEARVDMKHETVMGLSGVFGLQANTFTFSAKGDESFIPSTDNQTYSVFLFEERESGSFKPSFGLRLDSAQVKSKDDPNPLFGVGQTKSFTGGSASLGFVYQVTTSNSLVLNGAYTERAPNYEELFAHGPHAATAQYEIGDTGLKKEQSQSIELTWRHKEEESQGSLGVFLQDFHNYISLMPTGEPQVNGLDVFRFEAVNARIYGAELEYRHKLPSVIPGGTLEAEVKIDSLRGINRSTGDNLPRITPVRETVSLLYKADRIQSDLEVQRSERQSLTAPNETETAAYTLLNFGVEVPVQTEWASFSVFGRVNNIFDVEARNHVSVLKDVAPLPGRNVIVGLQASF